MYAWSIRRRSSACKQSPNSGSLAGARLCHHADDLTLATMSASAQDQLQAATKVFQKLQSDLSNVVEARQRLDAQLSENELVKKVNQSSP